MSDNNFADARLHYDLVKTSIMDPTLYQQVCNLWDEGHPPGKIKLHYVVVYGPESVELSQVSALLRILGDGNQGCAGCG